MYGNIYTLYFNFNFQIFKKRYNNGRWIEKRAGKFLSAKNCSILFNNNDKIICIYKRKNIVEKQLTFFIQSITFTDEVVVDWLVKYFLWYWTCNTPLLFCFLSFFLSLSLMLMLITNNFHNKKKVCCTLSTLQNMINKKKDNNSSFFIHWKCCVQLTIIIGMNQCFFISLVKYIKF